MELSYCYVFFFISVASKWAHLQRESSVETDFYDPVIMDTLARVFFLEHTWLSLNVLRTLNFVKIFYLVVTQTVLCKLTIKQGKKVT